MALATLKIARASAKRNLTLKLNATKVLLSDDNLDDINKNELSKLFKIFN